MLLMGCQGTCDMRFSLQESIIYNHDEESQGWKRAHSQIMSKVQTNCEPFCLHEHVFHWIYQCAFEYVQVKFRCFDMLAYMHNILVVWYLYTYIYMSNASCFQMPGKRNCMQRWTFLYWHCHWKIAAAMMFQLFRPSHDLRFAQNMDMSRRQLVVVSKLGDTDTAHPRAMMLCFVLKRFRLTTVRRSPRSRGLTFCYPQVQRIVIIFHCFTINLW